MLISHKGHTDTIQVYSVTVMTNVKALQAGHSSQGHLSLLHRCTRTDIPPVRMSPYMLIAHKELKNTIQVYFMTVMNHFITLEARQSNQGTFEPITPEYPDGGGGGPL